MRRAATPWISQRGESLVVKTSSLFCQPVTTRHRLRAKAASPARATRSDDIFQRRKRFVPL